MKNPFKKIHRTIGGYLRPLIENFSKSWRIPGRVRLANRWALNHPKWTALSVVGILFSLTVANFITIAQEDLTQKAMAESLTQIDDVDQVFEGLRRIQNFKESQRLDVVEMTRRGQTLKQELDSLIDIPEKSPADSAKIKRHYRELETIAKTLQYNETE